ncbi:MAG TPA: lactate utilization protein LutB domain-containing protein, partial [Verrucomicrobiae bacterium]|nr:lactate utilization protein LutB domain-containing protein [Verrucomicrobiae bacterium]
IDLHHHLLQNRRNASVGEPSEVERLAYKMFAFVVNRPGLYQFGKEVARLFQPLHKLVFGTRLDPARPWTATRDLPALKEETFKEWWRNRR